MRVLLTWLFLALPASGLRADPVEEARFLDRVWLDETPGAAEGAFVAFLSDGTLIQDSCGEVYRLAAWRRIDSTNLAWEEDGRTIEAEIVAAGPRELALRIGAPDHGAVTRRYGAARAPLVCPERR